MLRKQLKIISFFLVLLGLFSCGKDTEPNEEGRKSSGGTIMESGELAAVNSKSFVLPRYGRHWYEMRIIGILDHGEIVEPGDSIIQLDPTDVKRFIIDRETNLETQLATLQKLYVDQSNSINEQEARIKSETASFELKKIELESSRFESDRLKKIKELEFRQAEITLNKEKRKLDLRKIINENDRIIQEIRVQQIQTEINSAYEVLPQLVIRTPISGVFQIERSRRSRELLKIGDNVYPGNNMANVPELDKMKVITYINETDFLKIKEGQQVVVRLDALPKVDFEGVVSYIGKLCYPREKDSRQKVFDVEVEVLKVDERLKPGMTVSCEYLEES